MAAKKKTSPKKPVNKTKFVRSLPKTMPGAEVVKKAKEAGIDISLAYVYGIRSKSHARKRKSAPGSPIPPARRGPGRPPKSAACTGSGSTPAGAGRSSGLEAEIERIVEAKVAEMLKARLGALFGG